ncbi:unnamed protein product [Auanema sp. JU1783]|nr:unnamed protein product [Auanema sp. JU1783]
MSQRQKVVDLYKTLFYMGREYPKGSEWFHSRLKKAFLKNKDVSDPNEIGKLIKHGEFVVKEIEALYKLKKYRTLKDRYYSDQ